MTLLILLKRSFFVLIILLSFEFSNAQIELGYVLGLDLYQRMSNPSDASAYEGSGNALLNPFIGPKLWIGGKTVSLSMEAQINLGLTSLAIKDYKGMGAVSFPVMAKLNFSGMSGMYREFRWGMYLGGGMQWSKTELYNLRNSYKQLGVKRDLFPLYIAEIGIGRGGFGVDGSMYVRYGFGQDSDANSFHLGLIFNFLKTFERLPQKPKQ